MFGHVRGCGETARVDSETTNWRKQLVDAMTGAIPNRVVRWAASRGAPMARLSGQTSIGSAALAKALATLAQPPKRLWSRSSTGSAEEVADRVGRDPEDIRRWQASGMLGRQSGDQLDRAAFDRAALIDLALRSGADETALARAAVNGNLVWAAMESVLTAGGPMTGAQAADAAGVDIASIEAVWRSLGLPTGGLGAAGFDRRDVQALRTLQALGTVFSSEDRAEVASVIGRAMAEVSSAMVDVVARRLAEPLLEAGGTETDVVVRLAAMRDLLVPTLAPLLEVALERHLEAAIRSELSVRMEELVEPGAGHRILSVGFADLVGFTSASERMSAAEVRSLAAALHHVAEAATTQNGGRIVKGLGDAIMFTAPSPQQAAACALAIVDGVEADSSLPPVRIGVSHGPVLPGYADYFGRTVNLASRLCTAAGPGEVLLHVDDSVADRVDLAGIPADAATTSVGGLKGIDGEVRVMTLARTG